MSRQKRYKRSNYMHEDFYAIISSENELGLQDIRNECMEQSWVPLSVKYDKLKNTSKIIIFRSLSVAKSFIKRNYRKDEFLGVIKMPTKQIQQFLNDNLEIEFLDWPKSFKDLSDVKLGIEVIKLLDNPLLELHYK